MSDYSTTTPRIVGEIEAPQPPARAAKRAPAGKRGPGRYYLHGGERSEFARAVLDKLTPGKAVVIEFDDAETLQSYMLVLHNVNKTSRTRSHIPIRTRTFGLRLTVWLREDAAQMPLL